MQEKIAEEYKEFCKNRMKLKGDFAVQYEKMSKKIYENHDKIDNCLEQNEINTNAIKMILDAQMIDHLMQRQDVEDRKNLLMIAT